MRNIKIEYLRVFFMLLIILLHVLWMNYGGMNVCSIDYSFNCYLQLGLTNLVALGVTGFIFISSYYGIKLKLSRLMNLWFQTTFYTLLSAALLYVIYDQGGSRIFLFAPFEIFHGSYWFINDYVILMFLSPLLNIGIKKTNKTMLSFIIVCFTFSMYVVQKLKNIDASMPLLLFFNTYLIGGYLRLYPIRFLDKYKQIIFVVSLLLLIMEPILLHALGFDNYLKFVTGNYNILVLVSVITLFLICNSVKSYTKGNILTRNILAAYLVHASAFGKEMLHNHIFHNMNFNVLVIVFICSIILILSVVIEEIRKRSFGKIESKIIKSLKKIINVEEL